MSPTPRVVADFDTQLSTAIAIGATTFSIASYTDDDGVALANGVYCVTVDNGATNKEYLYGTMTAGNFTAVKSISRQGVQTTGAVRAHRVGASVIVTDFTAIKIIADIMSGRDTLDGTAPLIYDSTPTLSDGKQLATVAYVLGVVSGGTVYFSSQTFSSTAGETLATPNIVYLKEADQRWWKSAANSSATFDLVKLGIAQSSATAGGGVTIQLSGVCPGFTGLTAGQKYYLSDTSGAVSTTPGTTSVFIGYSLSTTQILMAVQELYRPSKKEKDAMAGGGSLGTPSTSNLFLTQTFWSAVNVLDTQTFNAGGTWTKPTTGKMARIQLWGPGGSGAASNNTGTRGVGGGGGGEYAELIVSVASLGATETVTIGTGGAAVAPGSGTNGNPGSGSSTFGAWLTAAAGQGGTEAAAGSEAGGAGGDAIGFGTPYAGTSAAPNGMYAAAGGKNAAGGKSIFGGAGGAGTTSSANTGGTSKYGGNGGASSVTNGVNGTDGTAPGGGGGSFNRTGGGANSGAGAAGRCIVTVF